MVLMIVTYNRILMVLMIVIYNTDGGDDGDIEY